MVLSYAMMEDRRDRRKTKRNKPNADDELEGISFEDREELEKSLLEQFGLGGDMDHLDDLYDTALISLVTSAFNCSDDNSTVSDGTIPVVPNDAVRKKYVKRAPRSIDHGEMVVEILKAAFKESIFYTCS